jgi:hypothetical protein
VERRLKSDGCPISAGALQSSGTVQPVGVERRRRRRVVRGWGGRFHEARIQSGFDVNTVATRLGIAGGHFSGLVDRYEAMPEPPVDAYNRARAGLILVGFGIDPAEFGIGEDELDLRRYAVLE